MFGYLTAYTDRLTQEEKDVYQGYYCGLCRTLAAKYGKKSSLVLAYDPVFLALLYTSLYESGEEFSRFRCFYKGTRVPLVQSESLDYAADVNLMLAFHNFRDKAYDSASKKAAMAVRFLEKPYLETAQRLPRQAAALENYMEALHACERRASDNPDEAANLTGKMTEEVFLLRHDEFEKYLRPVFFGLGKYIYLTDAYCDLEKDLETGEYNPYRSISNRADFEEMVLMHLEGVMGECTRNFEKLPLFLHREIMQNILYAGAWLGYRKTLKERKEKES
ncbi:MAG: hypothetical protein IKR59_03575 [Lachnospiraceae bacterium]|nr:hypothetical protein [Lachnospiraceae bacterium]